MSGPQSLLDNAGRLRTRMGACFVGSRAVFRGHDLHADLGDLGWIELYLFGITGRRFSVSQIRLLEAIWCYTSYPDARLWNNRVAALGGTARSTGNLSVAAALAVSEAAIFGRGIDFRAIVFLASARQALDKGESIADCVAAELAAHRSIAGYGRPIAAADERIGPILELAKSHGLADGPHVRAAFAVEDYLLAGRWRWRMNYGSVVAALAADLGLAADEYYMFMFPAFLAGMFPCFIEANNLEEGALLPISCDSVRYEGVSRRPWRSQPTAI